MAEIKFNFFYRALGVVGAVVLAVGAIGFGSWMIVNGAPAVGVALLISAVASLVGTAVYGHRAQSQKRPRG